LIEKRREEKRREEKRREEKRREEKREKQRVSLVPRFGLGVHWCHW